MSSVKKKAKFLELEQTMTQSIRDEDLARSPYSILTERYIEQSTKEYFIKEKEESEYQIYWDTYKQDALVLAVRQGNESTVENLIKFHIKEGRANKDTALWFACKYNNVKIAEMLLENGASPEYTLCDIPCIHLSALHGSSSLIFSFCKDYPKISTTRMQKSVQLEVTPDRPFVEFPYGALPLHMCAFGRLSSLSLLEELFKGTPGEKDVDVDVGDGSDMSPLMYASKGGNCFSVRALLQKGADIEHKCQTGKTSLLYAVGNGNNSVLELLIKRKACLEVRDNDSRGVFSYAKDEEVSNKILSTTISCREESAVELLPIHELITKGYHQTLKNVLDSMVTLQEDNVCVDLGQMELQPPDKEKKENLLYIVSKQDPDLPLFDSIVLRTYAKHHMTRYGYVYLTLLMLELILYLVVLSLALMLGVHGVNVNRADTPLEQFRLACEIYVLMRWGTLAFSQIIQFGVIFKHKYTSEMLDGSSNVLQKSIYCSLKEYVTDISNIIDTLVLLNALIYIVLRVSSIFVYVGLSTSAFAVLVYFFSMCIIFRYVTILPWIGCYLQTLLFALKDTIWFIAVFLITLFAFSGTFFISIHLPPYPTFYMNVTGKYEGVRDKFDEDYVWILLTGIRLLIEQASILKFNYLEVYNWLAIIVLMMFAFLTLLVLRTLYTGKIVSDYNRIKQSAKRYATYRRIIFLMDLHTKSIFSLSFFKIYLQTYQKKNILKKENLKSKHPIEFQKLFSRGEQEKMQSMFEEFREEQLERMEALENKLNEIIHLIQHKCIPIVNV